MSDTLTPPFDPDREIVLFGEGGDVKLIWFIDFTNPHTRRIRKTTWQAGEQIDSKTTVLGVRFSCLGKERDGAEIAARAAIAAHAQGRYNDMHERLFEHDAVFSEEIVTELAEDLGLDPESFAEDLHSDATSERLREDLVSWEESGAPKMPALFIDGRLYHGAWDEVAMLEAIERPLGERLRQATTDFIHWAASAGLVLVLATLCALIFANIGYHDLYEHWRETLAGFTFGEARFVLPVEVWVNDGLMALFFLLVGIEIKREIVDGELSDPARAALPVVGALGGMVVPAGIYVAFNAGLDTQHGWGIPMATDIAFTLGILALLGDRVPTSLKVFVSALAIADDLGAILVIALFYGDGFHVSALIVAGAIFALMLALNYARIYSRVPYMILGVILWYFVHESGLHATLAGVLTAAAIPSRRAGNIAGAAAQSAAIFEEEMEDPEVPVKPGALARLQNTIDRLRDPGFHLQHALESWSNYLILPLFAFFNTGILLFGSSFSIHAPEVLGVMAGLVIGKPLGIFLFVFFAVKLRLTSLSPDVNWLQILGAGFLCGVGFTMSIFIGSAAFEGSQLEAVKLSVLAASFIAAVTGVLVLVLAARRRAAEG